MLCSFYTRTSSPDHHHSYTSMLCSFYTRTSSPDHHRSYTSMLCSFYTRTSSPFIHTHAVFLLHTHIHAVFLHLHTLTHIVRLTSVHRSISLSLSLRLAVLPPSPVSLSLSRATIATTLIYDERRTLLPCARPSVWPCLPEVGGVPKLHADDGDRAFATVLRKRRTL